MLGTVIMLFNQQVDTCSVQTRTPATIARGRHLRVSGRTPERQVDGLFRRSLGRRATETRAEVAASALLYLREEIPAAGRTAECGRHSNKVICFNNIITLVCLSLIMNIYISAESFNRNAWAD